MEEQITQEMLDILTNIYELVSGNIFYLQIFLVVMLIIMLLLVVGVVKS